MSNLIPLPFRLSVPGEESIKFSGIKSVGYSLEGLLHLSDHVITIEWTGTQTTEQVSFAKVGTEVENLPIEWQEIPASEIADARVRRGWWSMIFELRSRRLDTFDDIPSGLSARLNLRIQRRDRGLAREMAVAINEASADAVLANAEEVSRLASVDEWDSGP